MFPEVWLVTLCVAPAVTLFVWIRIKGLEYTIIHQRWIFVCLFLLPLSVVYDALTFVRNWLVFRLNTAPLKHDKRVKEIQKQVHHCTLLYDARSSFLADFDSEI